MARLLNKIFADIVHCNNIRSQINLSYHVRRGFTNYLQLKYKRLGVDLGKEAIF